MSANEIQTESLVSAISEVSERVTLLVREEMELARAEVIAKAVSLVKGAAAIAVGAVFGLFALIFGLLALAWGLNDLISSLWIGFIIVFGVLVVLGGGTMMFAISKLRVGAPAPTMAIDEAKRIRQTVSASTGEALPAQSASRPGPGESP